MYLCVPVEEEDMASDSGDDEYDMPKKASVDNAHFLSIKFSDSPFPLEKI